ncbi:probable cyclin-dependent serine/threonine-protein kinase DDB_G0292550 [Schistocerca cancellata]|uniref:probable cyclin-dependent serine/threonine-protein kinase DDB_G0292550 n=1 Tax=Schistocerca cancellata TaxID=274614 RepID=UPI0021177F17|nr:probable cyclin-dependent serine/threonine-protein kinase DDB_G0292550 [Schistocerca cancellata]
MSEAAKRIEQIEIKQAEIPEVKDQQTRVATQENELAKDVQQAHERVAQLQTQSRAVERLESITEVKKIGMTIDETGENRSNRNQNSNFNGNNQPSWENKRRRGNYNNNNNYRQNGIWREPQYSNQGRQESRDQHLSNSRTYNGRGQWNDQRSEYVELRPPNPSQGSHRKNSNRHSHTAAVASSQNNAAETIGTSDIKLLQYEDTRELLQKEKVQYDESLLNVVK